MPNILDTVQISGSSYDLKDKNAPSVSAVTQQEYDNLPSSAKTSNTFFVITDAQAVDFTQYWTSAQTQSAITQATSGKVNTSSVVSSVTSASTDSEIPTAKAVWDVASQGGGGGGITSGEVQTMINESVSGKANSSDVYTKSETSGATELSTAFNEKLGSVGSSSADWLGIGITNLFKTFDGSYNTAYAYVASINQKPILSSSYLNVNEFSLVETSAITTSVTSSSTDAQVPSAKAVNDKLGGLSLVKLTQVEYSAMEQAGTLDNSTLYIVIDS